MWITHLTVLIGLLCFSKEAVADSEPHTGKPGEAGQWTFRGGTVPALARVGARAPALRLLSALGVAAA
jgi:hypothetical protein